MHASASCQDIVVAVAIDVRDGQAANAGDFAKGALEFEVARAVVEQYLAECHVVADREIQVAVAVQIRQFASVGSRSFVLQRSHHREFTSALV